MKTLAPGKLILSGEHAVVYGQPALAMAVNRYVSADISSIESPFITFTFSDLAYEQKVTLDALRKLKININDNYRQFKEGYLSIRDVLKEPFELAQFALSLCIDMLDLKFSQGIQIQISSTIPIGCGMGSSAATILSIMHGIANHMEVKISAQQIYEASLQAENRQHGVSSGLDVYVSLQGGCWYMLENRFSNKPLPTMKFFLINTGTPESSTGECVMKVAPLFKNTSIGTDFGTITDVMVASIQNNSPQAFKTAVHANHELLNKIGVVPERVQQFIRQINDLDGVAKICGAGAVKGDNGGIVMVVITDEPALTLLCGQYGYTLLHVSPEQRGVHVSV